MTATATRRRALRGGHSRQRPVARRAPLLASSDGEQGFVFARRVAGERALPSSGGYTFLSPGRLCRHVLVCGATGAGKTETLMRLAWTIAKTSDAQVFYLDGKGDRQGAERFSGLMADAGRSARVFANEPFAGWRGAPHEIQGRLMEIIDYATEGPAAYYRDVSKTALSLVCEHPDGPPRSSREVLHRLSHGALVAAHGPGSAASALTEDQVKQVRMRYEAFFAQTRGAIDGGWCWDDTDCAYLLLDSLALREETGGLARYLFEDFSQYFTARKARGRLCVLIVDEFSALAERSGMAARLEQARAFSTAIILAPQVVSGMGSVEQAERILGSVETVICHRVNTPEAVISLAGTRQVMEYSTALGPQGATGQGSARIQHQYKVDPNRVRQLAVGSAYVISRGKAMKVEVARAPAARAALPQGPVVVPVSKPERRRKALPF